MTFSLTCRHCHRAITGADEDDLVLRVQDHVREHAHEHGRSHAVTREQILARLHRDRRPGSTPPDRPEERST